MHDKMRVPYADPFNPTLRTSESLEVSIEQSNLIRQVLDYSSSDTLFAKKAYDAIHKILTEGSVLLPVIDSLNPTEMALGSPNFTLYVTGEGFDQDARIYWNNGEELTTRVSENELTTEVNMGTAEVATGIPVHVQNGSGLISNGMTFTLTPAGGAVRDTEDRDRIKENNDIARKLHKEAVGAFDNTLKDRSFLSPPSRNDAYRKDARHMAEESNFGVPVQQKLPFPDPTPTSKLVDSIKESHKAEKK